MTEHEEQARDEIGRVATECVDRAISRLRDMHDYAGRPAWDQVVAEEIRSALAALTPSLPSSGVSERRELCERLRADADWAERFVHAKTDTTGPGWDARHRARRHETDVAEVLILIDHQAAQLAGMREALAGALAALRLAHDRTLEARDSELFDTLRHTINVACREITALSEPDKDSRR